MDCQWSIDPDSHYSASCSKALCYCISNDFNELEFVALKQTTLFKLAAIYGYCISNNQSFIDGNKRAGYIISRLFLMMNGYDVRASESERVRMFLDISNNVKTEDDLTKWIEKSSVLIK